MNVFDVRKEVASPITKIEFFKKQDTEGHSLAYAVRPCGFTDGIELFDDLRDDGGEEGYVLVVNKEHAENLIKALNKAIELEWIV